MASEREDSEVGERVYAMSRAGEHLREQHGSEMADPVAMQCTSEKLCDLYSRLRDVTVNGVSQELNIY